MTESETLTRAEELNTFRDANENVSFSPRCHQHLQTRNLFLDQYSCFCVPSVGVTAPS